jgi:hypothetical protein
MAKSNGCSSSGCRDWLFFDIGNVVWLDEPMVCEHWVALHDLARQAGRGASFDELMSLRERLVLEQNDPVPHRTASDLLLGQSGWQAVRQLVEQRTGGEWHDYNIPVAGAKELLAELAG